jgi:hypothetical protein
MGEFILIFRLDLFPGLGFVALPPASMNFPREIHQEIHQLPRSTMIHHDGKIQGAR